MRITLVRHATLLVELGGRRLLVDPLLGEAGSLPPTPGTPSPRRNPLVPLPAGVDLAADAAIVTHLHRDHFDDAAAAALPASTPIFCRPGDEGSLRGHGFTEVTAVGGRLAWGGLRFLRTGGRHGHGELAERMGPVAGFVLRAADEPALYLAGDTVWCDEVAEALARERPDVVVVNAGAARFLEGEPITMDAADVARVVAAAPQARVVAVHLEAWNHCLLSRAELRAAVPAALVPADGETLAF